MANISSTDPFPDVAPEVLSDICALLLTELKNNSEAFPMPTDKYLEEFANQYHCRESNEDERESFFLTVRKQGQKTIWQSLRNAMNSSKERTNIFDLKNEEGTDTPLSLDLLILSVGTFERQDTAITNFLYRHIPPPPIEPDTKAAKDCLKTIKSNETFKKGFRQWSARECIRMEGRSDGGDDK